MLIHFSAAGWWTSRLPGQEGREDICQGGCQEDAEQTQCNHIKHSVIILARALFCPDRRAYMRKYNSRRNDEQLFHFGTGSKCIHVTSCKKVCDTKSRVILVPSGARTAEDETSAEKKRRKAECWSQAIHMKAAHMNALYMSAYNMNALYMNAHNMKALYINALCMNAFHMNAFHMNAHNMNAFHMNAHNMNALYMNAFML